MGSDGVSLVLFFFVFLSAKAFSSPRYPELGLASA